MRTIILGHNGSGTGPVNSANRYANLQGPGTGGSIWTGTLGLGRNPFPIAGTISKLKVRFPTATTITNGGTYTITLRNQSGATALTCTISSASILAEDMTNSVSVSVGDSFEWNVAPSGAPDGTAVTNVQISCVFDATTDGESLLMFGSTGSASNSATNYVGLSTGLTWSATEASRSVVIPCAGTIDKLYVLSNLSPGAGTSYTLTVRKGGTDQSLTCAITDTNTSNNDTTNSFSVSAGDILSVSCVPAGTPTARAVKGGMRFVPTVNGSTPIMGGGGNPSTTLVRYQNSIGLATNISTEGPALAIVPASCVLKNMYIDFDGSPGAAKSRAFISRVNTADGTVTATVSGTNTTANDTTHSDNLVKNDLVALSTTPSGTPGAPTNMRIGFVLYVAPSPSGYVYSPDLRSYFY